jgi:dTDP-glucose 4,6-dehydratase
MAETKNILVCGGAGFIGSNFIRYMMQMHPEYRIVNYDKLTYAGNIDNLKDVESLPNYKFIQGDIVDALKIDETIKQEGIDSIINFAAETHVDRSIHIGSREFVMTNVLGVQTLLDATRRYSLKKMINISTDEVYGTLQIGEDRLFTEETPFEPNVPYAAAKAGGDLLCRAYFHTFQVPVIVSHCSNNYGPYQFPEKLIPFFVTKAMKGEKLPLYGDGKNIRDWIYVLDHARAIEMMFEKGQPGEVYNIGANNELNNLQIADIILKQFNLPGDHIEFIEDRPGHDKRYGIDFSKIERELGWKPTYSFEEAVKETIDWYSKNPEWVHNVLERNKHINEYADHESPIQKA